MLQIGIVSSHFYENWLLEFRSTPLGMVIHGRYFVGYFTIIFTLLFPFLPSTKNLKKLKLGSHFPHLYSFK